MSSSRYCIRNVSQPSTYHSIMPPIRSVSEALDSLRQSQEFFWRKGDPWEVETFPFGLWFRGHSDSRMQLEPGVFRDKPSLSSEKRGLWDETDLYEHLRLRVPLPSRRCFSP